MICFSWKTLWQLSGSGHSLPALCCPSPRRYRPQASAPSDFSQAQEERDCPSKQQSPAAIREQLGKDLPPLLCRQQTKLGIFCAYLKTKVLDLSSNFWGVVALISMCARLSPLRGQSCAPVTEVAPAAGRAAPPLGRLLSHSQGFSPKAPGHSPASHHGRAPRNSTGWETGARVSGG